MCCRLHKLYTKGKLPPLPSTDEAADMYEETVNVNKEREMWWTSFLLFYID
jgi:hypothetical protein